VRSHHDVHSRAPPESDLIILSHQLLHALQIAAIGLGAIGTFLLARKILTRVGRSWREFQAKRRTARFQDQRKRELARREAAARGQGHDGEGGELSASLADGQAPSSLAQEGDDRLAGLCVVCIDRPVAVVFASCGHMCCCEQ
jgi:hypothetical protein